MEVSDVGFLVSPIFMEKIKELRIPETLIQEIWKDYVGVLIKGDHYSRLKTNWRPCGSLGVLVQEITLEQITQEAQTELTIACVSYASPPELELPEEYCTVFTLPEDEMIRITEAYSGN